MAILRLWGSIALYSRIKNVNFNEHTWMLVLYYIGVISLAISAVFIEKIYEKKKYKEVIKGILFPSLSRMYSFFCFAPHAPPSSKGRIVSMIWAWGLPPPVSCRHTSAHIPAATKCRFTYPRTCGY